MPGSWERRTPVRRLLPSRCSAHPGVPGGVGAASATTRNSSIPFGLSSATRAVALAVTFGFQTDLATETPAYGGKSQPHRSKFLGQSQNVATLTQSPFWGLRREDTKAGGRQQCSLTVDYLTAIKRAAGF